MSDQPGLFELPESGDPGSVALAEILDAYDVVSAERGDVLTGESPYIVVGPKGSMQSYLQADSTQLAEGSIPMAELGYSSPSPWTSWVREEWNSKLRDKQGVTEYYRMKRLDGIVRGSLRVFKTPVLSAHWFMKPGSDSARDKNVAKRVQDNLYAMSSSWSRTLEDILLMCEYGYMVMEKVYQLDPDGLLSLRKLAPRHPADIQQFIYDSNGGPAGILMEPQTLDTATNTTAPLTPLNPVEPQGVFIPISKLAVFSLEAEAGDMRGISILRSAYKHYQYKDTLYKIDAIQKERHGIGVPVIKMPPGWKAEDKKLAEQIGRNLRTNERSHIVLPPNWDIMFAKLEGQPVDCMVSISHHNDMIMVNVLAPFLTAANTKKESLETFYKATRYVAECVADTMNRFVIADLVNLNYSRVKVPILKVRRIGEWEDARTQSFTLRNYVGASLIVPDETLERHLREENDLPEIDFETRTPIAAPQDPNAPQDNPSSSNVNPVQPPRVGPPRQGAPTAKPPASTAGRDSSGGK
jgi:hypothetical protein